MACLHIESFDHYATADAATKGWTLGSGMSISAANGRRSTASLRYTSSGGTAKLAPIIAPTGTTVITGFSLKITTLGAAGSIWRVSDPTVDHVTVVSNTDGSLTAFRGTSGGTSLGSTAAGVIVAGVTNYIEIKVVIDDTVGTVTIRVNGASVLALTGVDTRNAGTAAWATITFGYAGTNTVDWDDVYVLDGSGSLNNDFLGDVRVDAQYPTANGNTSNSTPSTGTNRGTTIDDTAPNGDTDYNTLAAVNDKDTLTLADLVATGSTILAVQTSVNAKKTDAGLGSLAIVTRRAGTDYVGTAIPLTTTYGYIRELREIDPATSAAWTEANFNAMEIGYKRTA